MGCLKLTYYEREEALEKSSLFIEKGLEKNARAEKKCVKGYRYGFNGMERDNEWKGEGNSYTTHFRQYDPRLGRWLSMDPITHPWQSAYCSMDNNPINGTDPNGAAFWHSKARRQAIAKKKEFKEGGATNVTVNSVIDNEGYKRWYAEGGITTNAGGVISSRTFRTKNKDNTSPIGYSSVTDKSKISFSQSAGILIWNDNGGSGFTFTGPSVNISEVDLFKKDGNAPFETWESKYLIFKDGVKGTLIAGKMESLRGDVKGGITYETHFSSMMGVPRLVTNWSSSAGVGAPYAEAKVNYDGYSMILSAGFQEDWAKSINYYTLGWGIKLNAEYKGEISLKLNFLENLFESE